MTKKYLIVLIIILIASCVTYFIYKKNDNTSNGILWDGNKIVEVEQEQHSITIPCFNNITFQSNTIKQEVNLYNPKSNSCNMSFKIIMADGDVIWEEDNIKPGYGFHDITIKKSLNKGIYKDCILSVRCFKDNIELNGCDIDFDLQVY